MILDPFIDLRSQEKCAYRAVRTVFGPSHISSANLDDRGRHYQGSHYKNILITTKMAARGKNQDMNEYRILCIYFAGSALRQMMSRTENYVSAGPRTGPQPSPLYSLRSGRSNRNHQCLYRAIEFNAFSHEAHAGGFSSSSTEKQQLLCSFACI